MSKPIRVEYEDAVYHVMALRNEQRAVYRDVTQVSRVDPALLHWPTEGCACDAVEEPAFWGHLTHFGWEAKEGIQRTPYEAVL